ncbi:hypothetical protein D6D10_03818 [Aureobasidium pullulans]|uniref:Uncharacterized protein n=1 Tax=Aureobasidium pullulans TaxID=5580 RepID=A0A4S9EYS0_AURPU|nr:hypothetical protein D6D10_03818 [Aureobasidium pullulans]
MELLAHASAPSSRKDDERFKRQAKAYSSFQSASIVRLDLSQNHAGSSVPAVMEPSTMSRANQDASVYLDATQDAWTALDSQLYSASQESAYQNRLESDDEGNLDETIQPFPVDPSMPPRRVRTALPPDESVLLAKDSPKAAELQSSFSIPGFEPDGHESHVPTPSRSSHIDEHPTPSYLDGLSTFNLAETPVPRIALLRASKSSLPQENFSSPSDDIPSQLPSTYSISDINSDPVHSDQHHAPPSSEWGSLPRGSAPQPWNGIIEDESPLKGIRSLGKRRVQTSSPLKQTQSLESPRANMSAHIRPARSSAPSGQDEISSASLDRAVVPRTRQQTAPVRQTFSSSFELRFSSAPQAQGTPLISGRDLAPSSNVTQADFTDSATRSSFELRFSSAPQAQGTQLAVGSDAAAPAMLRRQSLQQLLPTSSASQFSSSPEARGTQSTYRSNTDVPAVLRQHSLGQLLPTSFESRFSSSPEAQGTPVPSSEDQVANRAQLSSSPSSKINLFQPGTKFFSRTKAPSSSAAETPIPDVSKSMTNNKTHTKSHPWHPTPSVSRLGSAVVHRALSENAGDVSTPLRSVRADKRTLLSARIPETVIAAKKRKLASLATPKAKPNTQERDIIKTLSTQINPPPPPTGSGSFATHITPQLQSQFGNADLQRIYKPHYPPNRELRPSERGYWQIDTRGWNAEIQIKFWSFLQTTIGSGASGWGIWCLRENGGNDDTEHQGEDEEPELGTVKIFCWGEVVRHVWLLCYVASNTKVKYVESQWFDADGEVVIRV